MWDNGVGMMYEDGRAQGGGASSGRTGLGLSTETQATSISTARVIASNGADVQADYDLIRRLYSNWFGGAARDSARDDRAAWLTTLASHGNVRAGQAILGGQGEMSGGEHDRYVRAEEYLRSNGAADVMDEANHAGAYWSYEDASNYPRLRAFVNGWVAELQAGASNVAATLTSHGGLPVAAIALGIGVVAVALMSGRKRG